MISKFSKYIMTISLFGFLILLITGCAGKEQSQYHGDWPAFAVSGEGLLVDFDRNNKEGIVLKVLEGNKLELKMGERTETGKWTDIENGIEIQSGSEKIPAIVEDGVLSLDIDGNVIYFHKADEEPAGKEKEITDQSFMKMDVNTLIDSIN